MMFIASCQSVLKLSYCNNLYQIWSIGTVYTESLPRGRVEDTKITLNRIEFKFL